MGKKKQQQSHAAVGEKQPVEATSSTQEVSEEVAEAQPQVPEASAVSEVALRFIDTSSKIGHGRFMTQFEKEKATEKVSESPIEAADPAPETSAPKVEPELPSAATLINTGMDLASESNGVSVHSLPVEAAASPVAEIRAGGESPEGEGATPISAQHHEADLALRGVPSPALSSVVPPVPNTSYNSSPDEHLLPPPNGEGEETDSSCDSDVTESKEEAEQAAAVEIVKILAFRITVALVLTTLSVFDKLKNLALLQTITENTKVQTIAETVIAALQRAWEEQGRPLAQDWEQKVKEVSPSGKKVVKVTKRSIQLARLAYQAVADEVSRIRHHKVE